MIEWQAVEEQEKVQLYLKAKCNRLTVDKMIECPLEMRTMRRIAEVVVEVVVIM